MTKKVTTQFDKVATIIDVTVMIQQVPGRFRSDAFQQKAADAFIAAGITDVKQVTHLARQMGFDHRSFKVADYVQQKTLKKS